MHETEQLIREVLSAGARGYVLKTDAGRHLTEAVEALSHRKPFFTAKVSGGAPGRLSKIRFKS